MTHQGIEGIVHRLRVALEGESASGRLQTALAAGLRPNPAYINPLAERFAAESDFFVRDMITWALMQQDRDLTLDRVLPELRSVFPSARSQALHTLAKLGDPRAWPAITTGLLHDAEDEVARTAWRTAATLVPAQEAAALAEDIATEFGRGDRFTQRSLSRALAMLGDAAGPAIQRATLHPDAAIRAHALATVQLIENPDVGFDVAIAAAQRVVALRDAPLVEDVG